MDEVSVLQVEKSKKISFNAGVRKETL